MTLLRGVLEKGKIHEDYKALHSYNAISSQRFIPT